MPYLSDRVLDNGLTVLDTEANALHICSQEPTTYDEAVTTGGGETFLLGSFTIRKPDPA